MKKIRLVMCFLMSLSVLLGMWPAAFASAVAIKVEDGAKTQVSQGRNSDSDQDGTFANLLPLVAEVEGEEDESGDDEPLAKSDFTFEYLVSHLHQVVHRPQLHLVVEESHYLHFRNLRL